MKIGSWAIAAGLSRRPDRSNVSPLRMKNTGTRKPNAIASSFVFRTAEPGAPWVATA